jgi:hypothetical protein
VAQEMDEGRRDHIMRWGEDTPLTKIAVVVVFTAMGWAAVTFIGGVLGLAAVAWACFMWIGLLRRPTPYALRLIGMVLGYGVAFVFLQEWWTSTRSYWSMPLFLGGGLTMILLALVEGSIGSSTGEHRR